MQNVSLRVGLKTLTAAAAAALGGLVAGCGQAAGNPPAAGQINYYEVRLEADAPNPAECHEAVAIRFEPVKVDSQPFDTLYQTTTYTDQPVITGHPVEDGKDNWECWFTYRSRDMAPGTWRIVGEFSSGPQSCERQIRPGLPNRLRIDQEDGCVEFTASELAGSGKPQ